jgi:hypothetical protein
MRREIQEILDEWCWLTFIGGRFRATRFCSDELLAELTVEEFLRNHYPDDRGLAGLRAEDIPEGMEFLFNSDRYAPLPGGGTPEARIGARFERDGKYWKAFQFGLFILSMLSTRRNYLVLAAAIERRRGQ